MPEYQPDYHQYMDRVTIKKGFLRWLPGAQTTALAIYPHIYLSDADYALFQEHPVPGHYALVAHEAVHLIRQKEKGVLLWWCLYILSAKFRMEEEFLSIKAEIKTNLKLGRRVPVEEMAVWYSSIFYLWAISYEDAAKRIRKLVQQLEQELG